MRKRGSTEKQTKKGSWRYSPSRHQFQDEDIRCSSKKLDAKKKGSKAFGDRQAGQGAGPKRRGKKGEIDGAQEKTTHSASTASVTGRSGVQRGKGRRGEKTKDPQKETNGKNKQKQTKKEKPIGEGIGRQPLEEQSREEKTSRGELEFVV